MIDKDDIAKACADNDNTVEGHDKFESVLDELGIEYEGMAYVAQQRAMRFIYHLKGRNPVPPSMVYELTEEELEQVKKFMVMFIDGFAGGVRANQQNQ